MVWPFALAALVEAATGLAALAVPGLVGRLLLGVAPDAAGAVLTRFGGIDRVSFALVTLRADDTAGHRHTRSGCSSRRSCSASGSRYRARACTGR